MSDVEQAKYTIVSKQGGIEIRDYAPAIVAETTVADAREVAIKKGLRTIADYIFGNNISLEKVAMTAPVTQQPNGNQWKVHFVMPANYTMATLPKPNNPEVTVKQIPGTRCVVERFSGSFSKENIAEHTQALMVFIKEQKLYSLSPPAYAFYNPPWTLPFLRRNEVLVEIAK